MPDAPPQKPRQPKLRSSCDQCGLAKLKCDRGSPQCGRCTTLGLDCVYGVSRKMGKPPREKIRVGAVSGVTHGTGDQTNGFERVNSDETACGKGDSGAISDSLAMDPHPLPNFNNQPLSWGAFDGYGANLLTASHAADSSSTGFPGFSLPDLMSIDENHDLFSNYHPPEIEGLSLPSTQSRISLARMSETTGAEDAFGNPPSGSDHDCNSEAYGILIKLSTSRSKSAPGASLPAPAQLASKSGDKHKIPVDQILRLNREAGERLGSLLTCSCSRTPHLALLYASIISLILALYQQAAGYSQMDSAADRVSCSVSSLGSLSGSQSPWSSTITSSADERGFGNPTISGAVGLALEPAQMTMGSFRVDDQEVRAALTIQLLLGEIKRAGHLIDLLSSRSSSGIDEMPVDGVDSLYRNLTTWLRREHARILESLKSRLEEIGP